MSYILIGIIIALAVAAFYAAVKFGEKKADARWLNNFIKAEQKKQKELNAYNHDVDKMVSDSKRSWAGVVPKLRKLSKKFKIRLP